MRNLKKLVILIMVLITLNGFSSKKLTTEDRKEIISILDSYKIENDNKIAKERKEMRGIWVATVLNIDWPSKKGLSIESQKQEFIKILDNVKEWNMNAVFVQIKPVGDAFYPSKFSPWSEYLTGKQGENPGYDPLKFMIEEAHKRNIEFHAWVNPYRLTMSGGIDKLSNDNIGKQRPDWTITYGGKLYLNPGIPEVNDYIVKSIMEVVENYDIDGVHMDDYFYPYKVKGEIYNDEEQYNKYGSNFLKVDDWRRDNVNKLIEKLYSSIKHKNKNIEFGISPFGVWRNISTDSVRGSNTKAGIQNYDDLYADILYWMKKNWIDYVAPQIYWNQGFKIAEYNTLVDWWSKYAKETKTNLYIGQAAYRIKDWEKDDELINQIKYNRKSEEVKGSIFFSYSSLVKDPKGILEKIKNDVYSKEE